MRKYRAVRNYYSLAGALVLSLVLVGFTAPPARAQKGVMMHPSGEITSGKLQFRRYCAQCHGLDGKGDGPVAPALKQAPADLTLLTEKGGGTFPEEKVVNAIDGTTVVTSHGTREMPIWGRTFFLRQPTRTGGGAPPLGQREISMKINMLVAYIKSIQKK